MGKKFSTIINDKTPTTSVQQQQIPKWVKIRTPKPVTLIELLLNFYTRSCNGQEMIITKDIMSLIELYFPFYMLLFNFEYDKQIYVQTHDISPNLRTNNINCHLYRIDWCCNNNDTYKAQYLPFEKVDKDYKVEYFFQQPALFNHKLIQASSNGIDYGKWKAFIHKFNTEANININGYIEKYGKWNGTAVGFDKIDHNVIDFIGMEFENCTLRSRWSLKIGNLSDYEYNVHGTCKPSEWVCNHLSLNKLDLDDRKIPIYYAEYILSKHTMYFNLTIKCGDDEYYQSQEPFPRADHLEMTLFSNSMELSAQLRGKKENRKQEFVDAVKAIISMFEWNSAKKKEIINRFVSYGTTCRQEGAYNEKNQYEVLMIIDKLSECFKTEIKVDGGFTISW